MAAIPPVIHRARPPTQAAPESSKPEKGKDKGKSAVPEPEPEPEVDPEGGGCLLFCLTPLTMLFYALEVPFYPLPSPFLNMNIENSIIVSGFKVVLIRNIIFIK